MGVFYSVIDILEQQVLASGPGFTQRLDGI